MRIVLPVNTFQNPDGTPVANGYLLIRLNQDGSVNDTQIQSNFTQISLDSSGSIVGSPTFWQNANINPPGTYYILSVFSATGQLVSSPNVVTL